MNVLLSKKYDEIIVIQLIIIYITKHMNNFRPKIKTITSNGVLVRSKLASVLNNTNKINNNVLVDEGTHSHIPKVFILSN